MSDNPNSFSGEALMPIGQLTYEQAIVELETIVTTLERDEQPLETALAQFARGQALIKHCADLLNQAELRVQELSVSGLNDFNPQA